MKTKDNFFSAQTGFYFYSYFISYATIVDSAPVVWIITLARWYEDSDRFPYTAVDRSWLDQAALPTLLVELLCIYI